MKYYTKTVEMPRLEIRNDSDAESPREDDGNAGYFITVDRHMQSPEDHGRDKDHVFYNIVKQTGEEATSQAQHMQLIKKEVKDQTGYRVMYICPIVKYEHGNVVYKRGEAHGFDYSNNGFYIVTDKSQEGKTYHDGFESYIDKELELYTQWANGEVYHFMLYDEAGKFVDGCGGFYSLEDIKANLPEEWADEDLKDYVS